MLQPSARGLGAPLGECLSPHNVRVHLHVQSPCSHNRAARLPLNFSQSTCARRAARSINDRARQKSSFHRSLPRTPRDRMNTRAIVLTCASLAVYTSGCAQAPDESSDEDATGTTATTTSTSTTTPTGCFNFSHWICNGETGGCVANCANKNLIICGSYCVHSPSGASCAPPPGTGCAICQAAAQLCFSGEIVP